MKTLWHDNDHYYQCKPSVSLCRIGLVKDHGDHRTTVGDQISTVRKTNTKHDEVNVQTKEHACVHKGVTQIELWKFGVAKKLHYLHVSSIGSE